MRAGSLIRMSVSIFLAVPVGALLAGLYFAGAATVYAEVGVALNPPVGEEYWGYGIYVGICAIAAAIGGAIAGIIGVASSGKARLVVPAMMGHSPEDSLALQHLWELVVLWTP